MSKSWLEQMDTPVVQVAPVAKVKPMSLGELRRINRNLKSWPKYEASVKSVNAMSTPRVWKVLSIRQPWAWLILHGGKDVENRDWATKVRGRVLIHASGTMTRADYEACTLFIAGMRTSWRLPAYDVLRELCGGIVGSVEIVKCVASSESPWFCGEFGFVLANPEVREFTPMKGRLGFFEVEA